MVKIRKFGKNVDSLDNILSIINDAYKIEIGQEGVAFKKFDRLGSTEEIQADQLHIALIGHQIVGIINISSRQNVAEIGTSVLCKLHIIIILFARTHCCK